MAHDYRAIVEAGFLLQLDCPDLAMDHQLYFADAPLSAFREHVGQSIRALNAALEGIPPEARESMSVMAITPVRITWTLAWATSSISS